MWKVMTALTKQKNTDIWNNILSNNTWIKKDIFEMFNILPLVCFFLLDKQA